MITTVNFITTKMLFTNADSFVPLINNRDKRHTIKIAGKLIIPPSAGALENSGGIDMPNWANNLFKYEPQLTPTVAAPSAYSKTNPNR